MHFLTKIQLCKQDVCELVGGAEFVDSRILSSILSALILVIQTGFNKRRALSALLTSRGFNLTILNGKLHGHKDNYGRAE